MDYTLIRAWKTAFLLAAVSSLKVCTLKVFYAKEKRYSKLFTFGLISWTHRITVYYLPYYNNLIHHTLREAFFITELFLRF